MGKGRLWRDTWAKNDGVYPGRPDGRSNSEVIVGMVLSKAPGDVLKYEDIQDALSHAHHFFGLDDVQKAVGNAVMAISETCGRVLVNIPTIGYRVGYATEHVQVAQHRAGCATRQVKKAAKALRHVHRDEMTPEEQERHNDELKAIAGQEAHLRAQNGSAARRERALRAARQMHVEV